MFPFVSLLTGLSHHPLSASFHASFATTATPYRSLACTGYFNRNIRCKKAFPAGYLAYQVNNIACLIGPVPRRLYNPGRFPYNTVGSLHHTEQVSLMTDLLFPLRRLFFRPITGLQEFNALRGHRSDLPGVTFLSTEV
jgi:hypothetical protein